MKTLVAYLSMTGNTKKVAEAIYNEIPGEKEMKELKDVPSLQGYDLAFIGFPIHASNPASQAREWLEKNSPGHKIALFITHAAPEEAEDLQPMLERCKEAAAEADLIGCFDCQGELAQEIIDFLLKSEDPKRRAFGEYGPRTKGQPDATRLERARAFAREIVERLEKQ